jgi:hypothetical protein
MKAPMTLLPLAEKMLVAAYAGQFETGEPTDWQAWGEAAGEGHLTASRALGDLWGRDLVSPAGGRLRVTTRGAERIERGGFTDPDLLGLIGRQFALRRAILRALEAWRTEDVADAEAAVGVSSVSGLRLEQIAAALGEPAARVAPALAVLREQFLIQAGEDRATLRISQPGRRALQAVRQAWPLSQALEGIGRQRRA